MRRLAEGNADNEQIASLTEHTHEQIEKATLRLGPPRPGGHYDNYVSIHRWRYCPTCLKEGKPHLRLWLIPFVSACPEHKCELVDSCRECGHPNAINLPLVPYCYRCQVWSEAHPAHTHEITCSEDLCRHINNPDELKIRLDRLMTAWYLSTSEALRPHFRFSPQLQTVTDMRGLVIQLWPAAASSERLADAINTQIESLAKRWPLLPAIPTMLINRAKRAGAVLPRRNATLRHRVELLSESDPWWVPLSVAAEASGIAVRVMGRLVSARVVRSKLFNEIGNDGNRHAFHMVSMDHCHQLITNLLQKAVRAENGEKHTNTLWRTLDEAIRDVNRGNISSFALGDDALNVPMIRLNEVRGVSRKQHKPARTLTSAETCDLLGTYHAIVADLAEREILMIHPESHSRHLLIDQVSALAFNEQYILVGTLAKQHGLNSTNLAEKLASLGVRPAPIEALVTIYRRTDILSVDFDSVRTVEIYETKAGRKFTAHPEPAAEPRLKKLIELVEQHDGPAAFCRKFNYSMGALSIFLNGKKMFGTLAAKRMEKRCRLTGGYFSDLQ